MTNEELKLRFPIGKLYKIRFTEYKYFEATVNKKFITLSCEEEIFLMLNIEKENDHCKITGLLASGQVCTIGYVRENEILLLKYFQEK